MQLKHKAPKAHTYLEIVKCRWGTQAHLVRLAAAAERWQPVACILHYSASGAELRPDCRSTSSWGSSSTSLCRCAYQRCAALVTLPWPGRYCCYCF